MNSLKTPMPKTEGVLEKKQFIKENAQNWKELASKTKKFKNGFEVKFEIKGMAFMSCICSCIIGILGGSATTVFAGGCSLVA